MKPFYRLRRSSYTGGEGYRGNLTGKVLGTELFAHGQDLIALLEGTPPDNLGHTGDRGKQFTLTKFHVQTGALRGISGAG